MEARASAKYLRGSAQKARLVIDMIRGKKVGNALGILRFANKRAADGIEKCLLSAIANAKEAGEKANVIVDEDELWINTCFVDRGPTKNRRRVRPAPQGRAYREQRHYCHITMTVTSDPKVVDGTKPVRDAAETPAASKAKKRGGAAAAPRAKKAAPKKTEPKAAEPVEAVEPAPVVEAVEETPKPAAKKAAKPAEPVEAVEAAPVVEETEETPKPAAKKAAKPRAKKTETTDAPEGDDSTTE
jgi:large subunit ribosomal protein L22